MPITIEDQFSWRPKNFDANKFIVTPAPEAQEWFKEVLTNSQEFFQQGIGESNVEVTPTQDVRIEDFSLQELNNKLFSNIGLSIRLPRDYYTFARIESQFYGIDQNYAVNERMNLLEELAVPGQPELQIVNQRAWDAMRADQTNDLVVTPDDQWRELHKIHDLETEIFKWRVATENGQEFDTGKLEALNAGYVMRQEEHDREIKASIVPNPDALSFIDKVNERVAEQTTQAVEAVSTTQPVISTTAPTEKALEPLEAVQKLATTPTPEAIQQAPQEPILAAEQTKEVTPEAMEPAWLNRKGYSAANKATADKFKEKLDGELARENRTHVEPEWVKREGYSEATLNMINKANESIAQEVKKHEEEQAQQRATYRELESVKKAEFMEYASLTNPTLDDVESAFSSGKFKNYFDNTRIASRITVDERNILKIHERDDLQKHLANGTLSSLSDDLTVGRVVDYYKELTDAHNTNDELRKTRDNGQLFDRQAYNKADEAIGLAVADLVRDHNQQITGEVDGSFRLLSLAQQIEHQKLTNDIAERFDDKLPDDDRLTNLYTSYSRMENANRIAAIEAKYPELTAIEQAPVLEVANPGFVTMEQAKERISHYREKYEALHANDKPAVAPVQGEQKLPVKQQTAHDKVPETVALTPEATQKSTKGSHADWLAEQGRKALEQHEQLKAQALEGKSEVEQQAVKRAMASMPITAFIEQHHKRITMS